MCPSQCSGNEGKLFHKDLAGSGGQYLSRRIGVGLCVCATQLLADKREGGAEGRFGPGQSTPRLCVPSQCSGNEGKLFHKDLAGLSGGLHLSRRIEVGPLIMI